MWYYALRTLFQNKPRLLISTGGVALALTLILALDAIFAGVQGQLSTYVDSSGADIFVAQSGVENLHMVSSTLPSSVVSQVEAVPGVASVTPIMYMTDTLVIGPNQDRYVVYVIGLPRGATMGGPARIDQGVALLARGQAVIDRSIAAKYGLGLGGKVTILGQPFAVAGLSDGTANLLNSVAFISMDDFVRIHGDTQQTVSFVLAKVKAGASPDAIAARIQQHVSGVTALSREAFAAQERKLVTDMAIDVINAMNVVGFLVGLAVMALTVYTATHSRRAEYGILKALGARNRYLYGTVLLQALYSIMLGFALALAITLLLALLVPALGFNLALQVSGASLLQVGGLSLLIAALSALLPIRQIAGLDPAMVFKGA